MLRFLIKYLKCIYYNFWVVKICILKNNKHFKSSNFVLIKVEKSNKIKIN
jgi:hypothetical protein